MTTPLPIAVTPARTPRIAVPGTAYEIVRPLGKGAAGRVYETRRAGSPTHFALKVLHPELFSGDDVAERLRDDVNRLAGLLPLDRVAPVADVGTTADGRVFCATALRPGRSLRAELRLRQRAADADRRSWAGTVAVHVLDALDALHAAGVVHGNVHPGNIFLRDDGVAMLLDVGVALCLGPLANGGAGGPGRPLVAPPYAAPEGTHGAWAGDLADVYSLGVVLGELFGEGPPERRENEADRRPGDAPSSERRRSLEAVRRVVRRATERRPDDRYPSARALGDDLSAALGERRDDMGPWLAPASAVDVALARRGLLASPAPSAPPTSLAEGDTGAPASPSAGAPRPGAPARRAGRAPGLATVAGGALVLVTGAALALRGAGGTGAAGAAPAGGSLARDEAPHAMATSMQASTPGEASAAPDSPSAPAPTLAPSPPPPAARLASPEGPADEPHGAALAATEEAPPSTRGAPSAAADVTPAAPTPTAPPPAPAASTEGAASVAIGASAPPPKKRARPEPAVPRPVKRWIPIEIGGKKL